MYRDVCLVRNLTVLRYISRRWAASSSNASHNQHGDDVQVERKSNDYSERDLSTADQSIQNCALSKAAACRWAAEFRQGKRPGSDSYAYDNPWPKLNGGRLDWLFGDGWRRPLAKDQGAKMRREWIWFSQIAYDEHKDWLRFHQIAFVLFTVLTTWFTCWIVFAKPDWPNGREWALREAHLEMARREKAGLPYISKDLVRADKVAATLPSEEELRDFDILI
ncbi:unnamed protein product [Anisakis simplex]|uniref:NADH dehydrogenase [ubiquinone] 1 beta subcomplex subunit 11, mitochondrial n=1 Tax=Anisakis simplex TaxID=6269 RepID=A0A0M3JTS6_ANISI|nr:unnamed protein product [Anisakis simplex]